MHKLVLALLLAAAPFAAPALADEAPPPKTTKKEPAKEPKKDDKNGKATKAQRGEACKSNADCDQNDQPMQCRDNKCEPRGPVHPVT